MTQRLAEVLIRVLNLIGKTSIFSKFTLSSIVLLQMNLQKQEATDRKLHETQVKHYDFTMFWSRITTSHGIAVK